MNLYGKTAGIVGTGKIGAAMARICQGFGMRVIGYDLYPNKDLDFVEYVDFEHLLAESGLDLPALSAAKDQLPHD